MCCPHDGHGDNAVCAAPWEGACLAPWTAPDRTAAAAKRPPALPEGAAPTAAAAVPAAAPVPWQAMLRRVLDLVRAGRVRARDEEAVAMAQTLFRTEQVPWSHHVF